MSSHGLIVFILGFCVGGGTAAVHRLHTGDAGKFESHLMQFFSFNNFFKRTLYSEGDVTNTELRDIKQLMGYRDAQ